MFLLTLKKIFIAHILSLLTLDFLGIFLFQVSL